ncbi:lipopolysaccharide biosynthesis protein [Nocardioides immobilis]|uniref:Lipopolysaccharide biosynthesis protein n=1 Tax=Nocardioides immobilis TaxID=2049295 RepID=A0A417XTD0_9ACTN|nr:lipopolysaccharide biosynthesis protein [Nocardioides immobilis]
MSDWKPAADHSPSEAIRGGAVVALSRIGRQVITLCITILLARLLTPAEFGAVAVITALVALGLVLQQAGLSSATVQRERVSTQAISTMFWINAAFGLTLTVLFAVLADPIASFLKHPELEVLCQATSVTFVLNGLTVQHRALLQRSMRFGTTARIDIGSALCGGLCAIAVAVAGYGYWALVAQVLVSDALALLMLLPSVRWSLTRPVLTGEVREMVAFGGSLLGFSLVVTAANNLHVVLLGRGAGTTAVGIYTRAYALASVPQNLLQGAAAYVALPKLARAHRDEEGLADFYYGSVQLLCLVALPVALAFALFGDQIALIVYGAQWGDVAEVLRIFAVGLAVTPLLHSTGPVLLARGEPHRMFRWGVFGACVILAGTLVGLRWGITGVACGWSTTTVLLLLPCLVYCLRGTGLTVRGLGRAVGGIYGAAACALPAGWLARHTLADLPSLVALPLGLGFTLLVYIGLCYVAFGQQALIQKVIRRLLPRPGRTAE